MTTDSNTISAVENPALANQLAAEAMSAAQEPAAPVVKTAVQLPPETEVKLPGGFLDPFVGLIDTAEIRELNGADEEAISKVNDPGKALMTVLERATVKIGEEKATKATLDALLAGDREQILLAIRNATFGSEIKLGPGPCPFCAEVQTFEVDLAKDVKTKLINEEDRVFTVSTASGDVKVKLPTGDTQKAIVNSTDKTSAEIDSIILMGCIISINDAAVISIDQIRKLSVATRRKLLEEISNRNPGPQLGELTKPCQSCGQEVPLPLTLADLFR
jgi:hypothetical protein